MPDIETKSFGISDLDISSQTWWPHLHKVIIESFQQKPHHAFPRHWTRLNPDPAKGAGDLINELGPDGRAVIVFSSADPVAFGAVVPTEPYDWSWKLRCICVHPCARGQNSSTVLLDTLVEHVQVRGGERITSTYVPKELRSFWRKQGFEDVEGSESCLPLGYKPADQPEEEEGLKEEIWFRTGLLQL